MKARVHHATLFALYQLCIMLGILAMPLAMAARQVGFRLPFHRLIENVGTAYEATQDN